MRMGSDMATTPGTPPKTYDELERAIAAHYDSLSGQLQRIAHFVLDNPDLPALETITTLAGHVRVQPSSMVRFAQALGFDGFTSMQRLFRARLIEGSVSYRERIHDLRRRRGGSKAGDPSDILSEFVDQGIASLEVLRANTPADDIQAAVSILAGAKEVYLVAQRRSFPVAFYMSYALARLEQRCRLAGGVGGLFQQEIRAAAPGDAILAISFRSYSPDVVEAVAERAEAGVPVVAISDSPLSPLALKAKVCLEIADPDDPAFRSLVAPMCLAQTLVVALGAHLDAGRPKTRKRGKR